MNRHVSCASIVFFFLFSLLMTSFFFELANANPVEIPPPNSIFIRNDGSVSGTEKIVQNGNVYSLTDHLALSYKFIVVQRNNIVLDGAHYTVTGDLSSGDYISTGIYVDGPSNITIQNFILSNFNVAINVVHSRQTKILNNIFEKNNVGVDLHGNLSDLGYLVFRNNFVSNNFDIGVTTGFSWDNGSVGNFWSNYSGSDLNGDGIGDTPYQITQRDVDNYPLIAPVNIILRPDPTIEPVPSSSVIEPTEKPTQTPTPQISPTGTPQTLPSPSITYTPSTIHSLQPTTDTNLTPSLTPSPAQTQTLSPSQTVSPTQSPSPTSSSSPIGGNFNLQLSALWIVAAVVIVVSLPAVFMAYRLRRKQKSST